MATKHGFVTRQWQRLLFFHCLFILFLYSEDDAFSVSPEGVLHDLGGGGLVATIVNVVYAFHHLFEERSHAEIEFGRNLGKGVGEIEIQLIIMGGGWVEAKLRMKTTVGKWLKMERNS